MADHALSDNGTYQDEAPVLEGVIPSTTEAPEGVDVTTFPDLQDLRRILPAQRFQHQAALAALVEDLPEGFRDAAAGGKGVDMTNVTGADLNALATMFTRIQDTVLDTAVDREAMENWLIDQVDPLQAVMYGFTRVQAALGN